MRDRWRGWAALGVAAVLALGACDDGLGPERDPLEGTGRLFSVARPADAGRPSAFDLTPPDPRAVAVESPSATGTWDIVLSESDGALVLVPASAIPGQGNAVVAMDTTRAFADVEDAPSDTSEYGRTGVPVRTGRVYIVRSRRRSSCVYFSKLQPLAIDAEAATIRFEYLLNPNCNARSLRPVEDG